MTVLRLSSLSSKNTLTSSSLIPGAVLVPMPVDWSRCEYWVAATQVILALTGMGATLTLAQFVDILRRPYGVAFVLVLQYLCCPLLALGFGRLFDLSEGVTLGLLMVSVLPSGALSNLFTYLGAGNVPLSITATTASTLGCLLLTPLMLRTCQPSGFSSDLVMPVEEVLIQITVCLILPLSIGMAIGHHWPGRRLLVAKWCIRGCLVFLTILIAGSVASGQIDVFAYGLKVPAALMIYAAMLLGSVQLVAIFLFRFHADDAYTMGIEIAMRNTNVGLLLKASLWPAVTVGTDPIGQGVLYTVMFYGGMSLLLCMLPVVRRRIMRRIRGRRWTTVK